MTDRSGTARKMLVHERLEFVSIISSLNPQFLDPTLIRPTPDGGWTHPWKYFDSLRIYLLLTCFDVLGQPQSFIDFQSWLSSSSTEAERTAALLNAKSETDRIAAIKRVHHEYLTAYGTKNSFYRFVRDVLPPPIQDDLYRSINIRKIDSERNIEVEVVEAETDKLAFLYRIRNSFTHAGVSTGSPAGGVFEEHLMKPSAIDGIPMKWMEPIHWEDKGKLRMEYSVCDWPNVLIQAVQEGLSRVPN